MLYLCTGGLGFLAAPVVRKLIEQGHSVRVLDDCSRSDRSALDDLTFGTWNADGTYATSSLQIIKGDIRSKAYVEWAVGGDFGHPAVDSVLHFAAVNGTENFYKEPGRVLDVAVKGITNLIDVCKERKVPEFVLVSSSEVYQTPAVIPTPEDVPLTVPDPKNPRYSYAGGKIISELMCLWCGQFERLLICRPHNVFGPGARSDHVIPQFIERAMNLGGKHAFEIQGSGEEERAFCYIDDFVSGFLKVLECGKHRETYNIGVERATQIWDLASLVVGMVVGIGSEVRVMPTYIPAEGSTTRRCPKMNKLRALDWEPQVSLADGLRRTIEWYHNQRVAK